MRFTIFLALFLPTLSASAETVNSLASGLWSNPSTWKENAAPKAGDEVIIHPGHRIEYDTKSDAVIRSIRIAGTLTFKRDADTELNVGYIRIQPDSPDEKESAPGVEDIHEKEHKAPPASSPPAVLEVGSAISSIAPGHTARIRLHLIEGMDPENNPAIVCRPGGRMDFHGAPMSRTWVKLGADANPNDTTVILSEPVTGWNVGDEVILTGGPRGENIEDESPTEERTIKAIEGTTITLDSPLKQIHWGGGEYRSEIANLTRNVIVESADPKGEGTRGHTMYHWGSSGSIHYARFAHLGKKGVLGRYPIHFHKVEDTMRGSSVVGVAITDAQNRWVTIHGTQYMIVRDCVGFRTFGHGFFLEDATEVYNVLDGNLAVGALRGPQMKNQALPFDPNDAAGFWWANGKNTLIRNVSTENDEYGYRYDCQMTRSFDCTLPIRQPDGTTKKIDVRTIPIGRFESNEAHTEGFYGMVVAANGNSQPDSPIHDEKGLERIKGIDWTGPDEKHPHTIKKLRIWQAHYGFRPHSPNMLFEDVHLDHAAYGIYRPAFANHVYKNLHISHMGAEPFNRGMDDASAQIGSISVDGLTFGSGYGNNSTPLIQISDNNLSEKAETHLRNVTVNRDPKFQDRWPLVNRGVGPRVPRVTKNGVPIYIHDHYGPGRHAKIVSIEDAPEGSDFKEAPPLTGNESRVTEVKNISWPELLNPVDDDPPATVITSANWSPDGSTLTVRGTTTDNTETATVTVNGIPAKDLDFNFHRWEVTLHPHKHTNVLVAEATDAAGNKEQTPHLIPVPSSR